MKILHILYQSLPQVSGSSIRSRDILMSQKEVGLDVFAITAPFQEARSRSEIINGVKYYRARINKKDSISDKTKPFLKRLIRVFYILSFYKKIEKLITEEKPDVLHAHAVFICGLPTLILSRKYKIPMVYEVRSLWMLKKDNSVKSQFFIFVEKQLFNLEKFIMNKADKVVVINENLKKVLIELGVASSKILVVNNAVNTTFIENLKRDFEVSKSKKRLNFGYIGTLTPHEGIDLLIQAFSIFNKEHPNSSLHIYGSGLEENRIKQLCKSHDFIFFNGRIDPNSVNVAFEGIDIIVNPRYKNRLTDSVTPLKPLEAMAYEKLFIGSDVGGIKELVNHNVNGFLFKSGDVYSLVDLMKCVSCLSDERLKSIKMSALDYVIKEKSWLKNAERYKKIYEKLNFN
ncbi:glycosyltransferase family 4 protein [Galbibacter pacificus]|uniref:Glycosyltransferase family 4 protein n=1 Tax=Galbibacter pacificus TaxID=2996052 RepID=A0ABT6FND7_9FLAO|nr:glycosyltransferase family 4 protein [Galbibacter pacificus]MDG3581298.1 glycosyltransferase family 4 protein [Galbibacter pacificus]MDG3584776.1 glycosyltransferase family 4 protein [Galbibacter pacificus]